MTLRFYREENLSHEIIELCSATSLEGRPFYVFIQMNCRDYMRYKKALSGSKTVDLTNFGKILDTGWGQKPSHQTCQRILKEHTNIFEKGEELQFYFKGVDQILKNNSAAEK